MNKPFNGLALANIQQYQAFGEQVKIYGTVFLHEPCKTIFELHKLQKWLCPLAREGEELVAIVFVLLFAGGDLGGQSLREVMAERIEPVEDGDDFCLHFERRDRDFYRL